MPQLLPHFLHRTGLPTTSGSPRDRTISSLQGRSIPAIRGAAGCGLRHRPEAAAHQLRLANENFQERPLALASARKRLPLGVIAIGGRGDSNFRH